MELKIRVRKFGSFPPTLDGWTQEGQQRTANPSTPIVAYNDQIAFSFIREATRRGITAPGAFSTVISDDAPGAESAAPGLATVASPLYAVGLGAVNNLLAITGDARSMSVHPVVVPATLEVWETTGHVG